MQVQKVILAGWFLALLERDLEPKEFKEACRRNHGINEGLCASHDFCDANMVMDEAWGETVDHEMSPSSAVDAELWSGAWEIATTAMGVDGRVLMMKEIHAAWNGSDDKLGAVLWGLQDGYGTAGYTPPQGFDWSGIRDSSPAAVKAMYKSL